MLVLLLSISFSGFDSDFSDWDVATVNRSRHRKFQKTNIFMSVKKSGIKI
jgi:hypothetical protein